MRSSLEELVIVDVGSLCCIEDNSEDVGNVD